MILLIDNYDSFSYNLYQLIGSIDPDIRVIRNDAMTPEQIAALSPEAIVISPGPGRPEDAGVCIELIQTIGGRFPMLGVCLGHQAICAAFGATVSYARELMHGKQSVTRLDADCLLFAGCPDTVPVARYHSLAAVEATMPPCLAIVARTEDGEVMAVKHREHHVYGVQFHPESILTPQGPLMLKNFLRIAKQESIGAQKSRRKQRG
ncbi:MAG: aminodeoxychorismate/anthranilate synthase component II [Clostridiales bacterium]|nr:aminodeoxychorismate/anthranilate synthase component II [Clostridiales bacterium]